MRTSKTIAGLIGPTLVAISVAVVLNLGSFPALAQQVSRDPALIFFVWHPLVCCGSRHCVRSQYLGGRLARVW